MNKLEQLLSELCSDGVEYKKLGEIATDIYRGSGIKREQITPTGTPCVRYGEIYTTYGIWFDTCISHTDVTIINSPKYFEHGDILFVITGESVEDIAKSTAYVGHERCLAGGDVVVLKHTQNPKYLSYALATTNARKQKSSGKVKSKVVHSSVPAIKDIIIPVPPLPVQSEIVKILDNFTELTAELTARKKQYSEYLNILIDRKRFSNPSRIKLGELFDFRNGLSKGKEFFGRGTPFIRYTDVYNKRVLHKEDISSLVECTPSELEKRKVTRGDVLFTRTSETAEDVGWSSVMLEDIGDCVFNGFTIRATPKTERLLPEYCAYCFSTNEFRQYVTSHCAFTTRASLTGKTIAEYELAVPSISEQQKVVNVLDKLYLLCNSRSDGLPAEIAARQKQYEYYRGKLLTFREVSM